MKRRPTGPGSRPAGPGDGAGLGFHRTGGGTDPAGPGGSLRGGAEPTRRVDGEGARIYGEGAQAQPGGEHPLTPTRLLPQAPTPSGELVSLAEDLHVPAIIRMTQGRLPIE